MRFTRVLPIIVGAALGAMSLAATGCQSKPTPAPTAEALQATKLFVRNFTGHDVAVYVVPSENGNSVWLTNVPVGGSRSIGLKWSDLQPSGGLVVRTQIIGSSRTWTSDPLIIDDGIVGVLDLRTDKSLVTSASIFRGVTVQAFDAAMR